MLSRVNAIRDEFLATESLNDALEDTDVRDVFVQYLNATLSATRVYHNLYELPVDLIQDTDDSASNGR